MRRILLALVALVAGCGGSPADVSQFRRPGGPPVYWLGESFEGLPLVTTDTGTGRPDLIYGTCEASSDSGCAPPLELQQWALLEQPPTRFEITPGRKAACRTVPTSGVTAARFATSGGVEVYLGDRVVVIFGEPELARKALEELRPVRAQQPALPGPPAWVGRALARCR